MKKSLFALAAALLLSVVVRAQAPTMFAVFEDVVKPSNDAKFRDAVKKLKAACEANKLASGWTTIAFDDNTYHHALPIKSFADLDKNPFADLETKLGKDALGNIWTEIDQNVSGQSSFVARQLTEYSYLQPAAGNNAWLITFWYPELGRDAEVNALLADWKKLYETKKATNPYNVYRIEFGKPGYAFISWGKSPADAMEKEQKNNELLGDDGSKLWQRTAAISSRYYTRHGMTATDLSYTPPAK